MLHVDVQLLQRDVLAACRFDNAAQRLQSLLQLLRLTLTLTFVPKCLRVPLKAAFSQRAASGDESGAPIGHLLRRKYVFFRSRPPAVDRN